MATKKRPAHIEQAIERLKKPPAKAAPAAKLGKVIDRLYQAREQRLAAQREVDALKKQEDAVKQEVIAALNAEQLTGSKGRIASVTITPKVVPRANPEKWNDIFTWAVQHGHHALLYKRLSSEAFADLIEAGERVPNVESTTVLDLSLRAL